MIVNARFEKALRSSDPILELRRFAQQLLDEGNEPAAIQSQFEQKRQQLRTAGQEKEEDAIMDVMDFLSGWCSPHMKLETPPVEKSPKNHDTC